MPAYTHHMAGLPQMIRVLIPSMMARKVLSTALFGALTSTLMVWCVRDYREFRSLGPGGLPSNVIGWLLVTCLLRPVALSKRQATWTGDYSDEGAHKDVQALPIRRGPRAVAKGRVPHRQMSQNSPPVMRKHIQALFQTAIRRYPDLLLIKKSLYEKHNDALFVADSILTDPNAALASTATTSKGETAHLHDDLSVHVYLSPADAKVVIDKGWGERHLLARPKPLFGRYLFGIAPTYILLYGPRDDEELIVLRTLLENSIRFMTG